MLNRSCNFVGYPYNVTIVNEENGLVTVQEGQHTFLNCFVESGNEQMKQC
jgi:hypothetical protein